MTSEERLYRWFDDVPEAEKIDKETKLQIRKNVLKSIRQRLLMVLLINGILGLLAFLLLLRWLPNYLSGQLVLGCSFSARFWTIFIAVFLFLAIVAHALYAALRLKKEFLQKEVEATLTTMKKKTEHERPLTEDEKAAYKALVAELTDDDELISNMDSCLSSPHLFFAEREYFFWDWHFDDLMPAEEIAWVSLIDMLLYDGMIFFLDEEEALDDFCEYMELLAEGYDVEINKSMLAKSKGVRAWCAELNTIWAPKGVCVAQLENEGNCFLYVCPLEKVEKLSLLFQQAAPAKYKMKCLFSKVSS